ncbi:FkbM family methyltransferase [candidate division CSSED10-310 bacterium]|uniref:FkbM family methyltransferase n=1 Tax=candidate division CSSED10-310 bacterium TaxID=2855610 RepID=A0ABV6YVM8_UNCC1
MSPRTLVLVKRFMWRFKEAFKRRLYRLHPRSIYWRHHLRTRPDEPLTATIDHDLKARVWPGDVLGESLYVRGYFEQQETKFVKQILKPGMVFIDVGANMGYYSLLAAKLVGQAGQVHSFEPNPRMFQELTYNVELNGFSNISLNSQALADKPGQARLSRYDKGEEVYCSLSNSSYPGAEIIGYDDVSVQTLDNYINKNGIDKVDLIKIDVEGAELMVLQGAQNLLSDSRKLIVMLEFDQRLCDAFDYTVNDILQTLEEYDFKVYTLSDGLFEHVSETTDIHRLCSVNFAATNASFSYE